MAQSTVVGYISKYGNSFGGFNVVNERMDPHIWMLEYEMLLADLFALSLISYRPSTTITYTSGLQPR